MPLYKFTRSMKYTETLVVDADDRIKAEMIAMNSNDFEINHDDTEVDMDVKEIDPHAL